MTLNTNAKKVFNRIKKHAQKLGVYEPADDMDLKMLAYNYDLYEQMAAFCAVHGYTQKPEGGGWNQVRPEYTIMQKCYAYFMDHAGKYGLNPGDRVKIFKMKSKEVDDDPLKQLDFVKMARTAL